MKRIAFNTGASGRQKESALLTRLRCEVSARALTAILATFGVVFCIDPVRAESTPLKNLVVLRRPVAMVRAHDHLWVANRQTGTVSIIDPGTGRVRHEVAVSTRLDDLLPVPKTQTLVAVDSESDQLFTLQMTFSDDRPIDLKTLSVQSVARYPVSLAASPNGKLVSCASKWSRRLTVLQSSDLSAGHAPGDVADLPFPPLKQIFLSNRFVLVADAHGGELAVVDAQSGEIRSRQKLPGPLWIGELASSRLMAATSVISNHGQAASLSSSELADLLDFLKSL